MRRDEIKGDETRQKLVILHQGTSAGMTSYRGLWWKRLGALLWQFCLQVISSWKKQRTKSGPQKEDSGGPSSGDTITKSKSNIQYQEVRPHASSAFCYNPAMENCLECLWVCSYQAWSPGMPWTSHKRADGWFGRYQEDLNSLLLDGHISVAESWPF